MLPRALTSLLAGAAALMTSCNPSTEPDAAPPAAGPQPAFAPRLEAFVRDTLKRFDVPGFTVGIVHGGELVYTGAFGVTNVDTGEPVTAEHLFHMASVSKPFVATAVMQLVERGLMDLDATVTTYLPYFELADDGAREITIRQMLTHTSGMPDVRDYEWDKPQLDEGAAERYVRSLTEEKMIAAPGETFRYSNMAFDTLGDVIAKVSGQSFESYMKENILDPLGMRDSTFLYPETREDLRTHGHVWKLGPALADVYPYNRRHAPSSTLNSNVVEMANWALANLRRGELRGRRILKAESYDVLWEPAAEAGGDRHVGLSWFLGERHGFRTVEHAGGDTGFRSYLLLLPDEDLGVVCASNYSSGPTGELARAMVDIVLGHEPEAPKPSVVNAFVRALEEEGIEAARSLYRRLETESPDDYDFDDGHLNRLGYFYLGRQQAERAIDVFRFNADLYPEVANVYDSLGEAYAVAGDTELAISNYERVLQLEPDNANAQERLERLKAQ